MFDDVCRTTEVARLGHLALLMPSLKCSIYWSDRRMCLIPRAANFESACGCILELLLSRLKRFRSRMWQRYFVNLKSKRQLSYSVLFAKSYMRYLCSSVHKFRHLFKQSSVPSVSLLSSPISANIRACGLHKKKLRRQFYVRFRILFGLQKYWQ